MIIWHVCYCNCFSPCYLRWSSPEQVKICLRWVEPPCSFLQTGPQICCPKLVPYRYIYIYMYIYINNDIYIYIYIYNDIYIMIYIYTYPGYPGIPMKSLDMFMRVFFESSNLVGLSLAGCFNFLDCSSKWTDPNFIPFRTYPLVN